MADGRLFTPLAAGILLSCTTGCGVFSAIGNPKAAFALQEPAPMAVILRRAEAARATAKNVDRLLSSTGVDATSRWIPKLALKKADAEAALNEIGGDPDYTVPPGAKIRVVQAEAWARVLSGLCPHETKYPSLLAQISPEVGTSYAEVAGQAKAVAKLKADKTAEEAALDVKDISAADKEVHEKKKREIEEQIDKADAEYKPKIDAFMSKLRDASTKAPPAVKKQMSVALVSLKHAVDDAKLANSVALLRYPMAMPGMPQELKGQAKRIVADTVEDKTGHRPTLDKFEPDVKLEGGSVKLTLNGLPPEALGGLKPEALLADVTGRAKDYVVRVLTLTAYVAETQELLDLETEIIRSTMDGLAVEDGKVPEAGDDLSELKVELDAVAAANKGAGAVTAKGGKGGKPGGRYPVPAAMCDGAVKADDRVVKGDDKGAGAKAKGDKGPAPAHEGSSAPKPPAHEGTTAPKPPTPKKNEPLVD